MDDLTFRSQGDKELVAAVAVPPRPDDQTGALLWLHGWGGNRFQYESILPEFAERFNLYVVAPEWRGCGFDCDPVTGAGICTPYDFSHLQVVDALNALREARAAYRIDDRRLFAWGGGQGGHIAVLVAAYAPRTFAAVTNVAGFSYVDAAREAVLGWTLGPRDHEVRDARRFAGQIRSRVWLIHGDLDASVPIEHAHSLEGALRAGGARVETRFIAGAAHMLDPITDRRRATLEAMTDDYLNLRTDGRTELGQTTTVELPVTGGAFQVGFGGAVIEVHPPT